MLQIGCLLAEVSSVGFKALSNLPFLRTFSFNDESKSWETRQLKHLLMCIQFLPRLAIAGKMNLIKKFKFLCFRYSDYYGGYHDKVVHLPVQLSLEEVILERKVHPHPNCQLPNLRRVHWTSPCGDVVRFFNKFQTITELGLYGAEAKLVEQVVQKVGARLRKLVLEMSNCSLPGVFKDCPNLEFLRLEYCIFPDHTPTWPNNMFRFLQEVELDVDLFGKEVMPEGFIKHVYLNKKIIFRGYIELNTFLSSC